MERIDTRLEQKIGFDRIRKIISDKCSTTYAADRTATEVFSNKASEIRRRLLLTDEMRLIMMFEDSFPSGGFIDCIDFLKPLERTSAAIDILSLRKLKTMLETLRKVTSFFESIKDGVYPNLKRMSSRVLNFPEIQRRIELILDRYGDVKDTASEQLYEIRKSLREKEGAISRRMSAILKRAQEEGIVDSDAGVSIRDGKMLIPVSAANKKRIPGFIYDESATGKTAFIEPAEVVELDNQIKELKFAEQREILRILLEFTDFLRPYIPDLLSAAKYLGEIDFIMAKAQIALDFIAGMPVISEDGQMHLRKARHPLLERTLRKEKKEIVPLTATLTPEKHILLISGPNAGGKSVCLKTVGLLQYMFQWGMLIPTSETSEMLVFDRIMVDIGDDQSIENDLSTYSSFLGNMKDMLAAADDKTLVLIDEFGSGTEPAAGGAIAEAILSEFDKRGTYGVITTHYTNLKLYASPETGVLNGAMMFETYKDMFLYAFGIGDENKFKATVAKGTNTADAECGDYLKKSTLTTSDVTLAKIVNNGSNYVVTISVKEGNNIGAPIDKSGICSGNSDITGFDHKTRLVVAGVNFQTTDKTGNGKIVATINAATGKISKLVITWDTNTKISMSADLSANLATSTTVTYTNFGW
mgnify:CR=1 FL=1